MNVEETIDVSIAWHYPRGSRTQETLTVAQTEGAACCRCGGRRQNIVPVGVVEGGTGQLVYACDGGCGKGIL